MLKRPLISEKSMKLAQDSQYTFEVSRELNKMQIGHLVSARFKVDVVSVRTINVKGKTKNQRSRRKLYKTAGLKKAIVFLKAGQKIPLFETAQAEEEVAVTTAEAAEGEQVTVLKEKKSLLSGTKVRVEKDSSRGQDDLKTSHKEKKKGGSK